MILICSACGTKAPSDSSDASEVSSDTGEAHATDIDPGGDGDPVDGDLIDTDSGDEGDTEPGADTYEGLDTDTPTVSINDTNSGTGGDIADDTESEHETETLPLEDTALDTVTAIIDAGDIGDGGDAADGADGAVATDSDTIDTPTDTGDDNGHATDTGTVADTAPYTASDTLSESETETDTGAAVPTDSDTGPATESDSETATAMDAGTSDTATDTATDTAVTDPASDTATETDTGDETDSATDTGTGSAVDTGTGTATATETADTETATNDTEIPPGCKSYTFRQGEGFYRGAKDIEILSNSPSTNLSNEESLGVVTNDATHQVLMRFDDIFGIGCGLIPGDAAIASAHLSVTAHDGTQHNVSLHQMTIDWSAETTWDSLIGGVTLGDDAASQPEDTLVAPQTGAYSFDVTQSVTGWHQGLFENYGWAFLASDEDGWDFYSAKSSQMGYRPTLTVVGCVPELDIALHDPSDGSTDESTPPLLDVVVTDPAEGPVDVTFYGREKGGPWSLVVLPDTQTYSGENQGGTEAMFTSQTNWIVANKDAFNIKVVMHEGDIVESANLGSEWIFADTNMDVLTQAGIPFTAAPGDHDHYPEGALGNLDNFNAYFGASQFSSLPWWGGSYAGSVEDNNSSHYALLTIGGEEYVFIAMDFCPSTEELAWVGGDTENDGVLDTHASRKAILSTHGLIDGDGNYDITDDCERTGGSSAYIWETLNDHDNLEIILCGHMYHHDSNSPSRDAPYNGERYQAVPNDNSVPVHQLLANYQERANGGNGRLRIMTFYPDDDEVLVQTYSPHSDTYETDDDSQFTLSYSMLDSPAFVELGAADEVASGDHAQLSWTGLGAGTTYEWYVVASSAEISSATSRIWTFTTAL
jgi:hypothetical protein